MAFVPPPNPFYEESRMRERIAERDQVIPKFSRKRALIGIAIVVILAIAVFVILYAFH